ncbi:MAG TPA: PDZ domain-containing protein, partial [Elusimicrobiales bacterium]|nr:PDZ domain-containing protein [Elusimicrobiales bacterium]
ERLKAGQEAAPPAWAGVALAPLDQVLVKNLALSSREGALVQSVSSGSPADKAGLRHGDVITGIDGKPVADPAQAAELIGAMKAGDKAVFEIYREGKLRKIEVELRARPSVLWQNRSLYRKKTAAAKTAQWEGLSVAEEQDGVRVADMEPKSPLAEYLERGDLIVGVNGRAVKSAAGFASAVKDATLKDGVLFDIVRRGEPLYISVQVPGN